jgi:hypothetical protein
MRRLRKEEREMKRQSKRDGISPEYFLIRANMNTVYYTLISIRQNKIQTLNGM